MQHLVDNRYRILQRLGSGGMAEVYLAHDSVLNLDVAFKVLRPQYTSNPEFVERFKREARSAASLSHPNIISVRDWGEAKDGTHYIVMEYLSGGTLEERVLREEPLHPHVAAELTMQIGRALGEAHRNGVIHRDIKPQNILITDSGSVKVADFGIAKAADLAGITRTGYVLGTTRYMSPEQAGGENVGPRSDLYSLGVVLYEMLTGGLPQHANGRLRSPREVTPSVSEVMDAVTLRLLAKNPSDRYGSATELIKDLKRVRRGLAPSTATTRVADKVTKPLHPKPGGQAQKQGVGQSGHEKKGRKGSRRTGALTFSVLALVVIVAVVAAVAYELDAIPVPEPREKVEPKSEEPKSEPKEEKPEDESEPKKAPKPKDKDELKAKDEPKDEAEPKAKSVPKVSNTGNDVIFKDDFSGTTGGWPRTNGPEFVTDYANGGYRIYNPPPVSMNVIAVPNAAGSVKDARVEADAALTSGSSSAAWGVICRHVSTGNNYVMGIMGDGRSFITKTKNNASFNLAGGNPSDAVRKAPATNRIRGDCVGNKLTLYVNDRKLLAANDTDFPSGSVGLFGQYAAGPATDVYFDNFSASES